MPPSDVGKRRKAHRAGHIAEWAALIVLRLKGYRILARRYLVKGGEIDIIAQRRETVCFVEVKLRSKIDDALIAIDGSKRRRMARAARVFRAGRYDPGLIWRADAIYCAPWRWPRHIPSVFELETD